MYTLYYFPGNASLMPHMLLREIGAPFELRLVDRANNAQKGAEYLKLNPTGTIPVLLDDGMAIYETAAIALYLADRHPAAHLAPPFEATARGAYYKWMLLISNALQTQFRAWFYAHEFVDDPAYTDSVKAATAARIGRTFVQIGAHLETSPWLLGADFSAADLYLFMFVRWGRALPSPPRLIPALAGHAERVAARPAVREALAVEGIAAPYF
ncbi:MAG TPA: glutathione S-transferase N-terminal domain-containing protein [Rhizomicrobium sp.]|jgi:glutathione S-transferase|nr:glutathione S-transferase N-terminal domain-containing protein [Rhizomicrobium sp.]